MQIFINFVILSLIRWIWQKEVLMSANSILQELYSKGSRSLEILRKSAVTPHDVKILKQWGISDAAAMIGRTPQTLRNLEESGKIKTPQKIQNGKRIERIYSLKEINEIRELFKLRPSKPANAKPVVVGIVNFKGGVGKSFTSLTLSQSLALKGYKVLLIDGDSQGTSTHQGGGLIPDLHVKSDQTLLNVLIGDSDEIASCIIKTHWDGLDLIPANLTLYNAEMIIPNQIYQHRQKTGQVLPFYTRLKNSLDKVADDYDVIIIDTPPSLGFITLNVLFAVSGLMIPLLPSEVDYCSTIQFLNMAQESLNRLPPIDYHFVRLLISRHKPASMQAKTMEGAIRQVFGSSVMTNYMIETEAVSKASADMKTIYEVEPHANDKKTFKRATDHANQVAEELELLLKMVWNSPEKISETVTDYSEVN
ncbi:MAG: AAA family ATPase [Gammaproteobacteria bacterium]|nr:AAA family ATPase [Gammaproteobacteria bacterium]